METESRSDEPRSAEDTNFPGLDRTSRKTYLLGAAVLVIGFVVLGAAVFPSRDEAKPGPTLDPPIAPGARSGLPGPVPGPHETLAPIEHRLDVLSESLTQRLRHLESESGGIRSDLSSMAGQVRPVQDEVAALAETNTRILRQVEAVLSRLQVIATDIQALKARPKPAVRPPAKPPVAPPFHVDAIDHWDGATYVAISQNGRAAFLREGERQSGWRLTAVDPSTGKVTFQGPKGQVHSVSVPR